MRNLIKAAGRLFGSASPEDELARGLKAHERKDYKAALEAWLAAARTGHADAQYRLGRLYDLGQGVVRNVVDAVGWYRQAADQGHGEAQARLAEIYYYGCGQPKGIVPTDEALSVLFPKGLKIEQDYKEALRWARAAAEGGVVGAQFGARAGQRMRAERLRLLLGLLVLGVGVRFALDLLIQPSELFSIRFTGDGG